MNNSSIFVLVLLLTCPYLYITKIDNATQKRNYFMKRKNKYGAKKTIGADGRTYDSKLEAKRAHELQLMEKAGEIRNLKYQQEFPIEINEVTVCKYIADFTYLASAGGSEGFMFGGTPVVEDCKGVRTAVFNLKAKMFRAYYGFAISIYPPKARGKRVSRTKRKV